ncbi:DegT/DnrJ/EryC1/StrS aminotransferase family protein, partial [bacterium]|nr:DegT/DnrJ/EryC1/StrS aminotransferase family protein [bacterium]
KSCGISDISCTSFFPSKPLGCYGDGGAVFTNDDKIAEAMNEVRLHGQKKRYVHTRIGINGRMDTLQAAICLAKMPIFEDGVKTRERLGARYTAAIKERTDLVGVPFIEAHNTSPYAQYTVQVPQREKVQELLKAKGIPTAVHYPVPLNLQPVFEYLGQPRGSFPVAEAASERVMSLPMHPYLSDSDITRVADGLAEAVKAVSR